ncbi:hypothetical protein KIPB_003872 [Kipferlia bialata]|uniref:Uncharacterized protein n=1 Tax=Kipferlia bialata TaxID=797122 RepID=A0A9K3GHC2_9EUKA|nr:hypothetical protein KIPB_003872 [Kipferlia bialata]|eukprot:g3872.t1
MLGLEIALIVTFFYESYFSEAVEDGNPDRRQYYFGMLSLASVLFAAESALRFYLMYVSLSMEHEYWQAPRSTHMYYGPYVIAALGGACLAVVWLCYTVLGGILHVYPEESGRLSSKRAQYFDRHGMARHAPGVCNAVALEAPPVHTSPPISSCKESLPGIINVCTSSDDDNASASAADRETQEEQVGERVSISANTLPEEETENPAVIDTKRRRSLRIWPLRK